MLSQSASLCLCQISSSFGGSTIFKNTQKEIEFERLGDMLEKMAKRHHFRSGMDWLLCRLYPEYTDECRQYYKGTGADFQTKHPKMVQRIDILMSVCLRESFKIALKESLASGKIGHEKNTCDGSKGNAGKDAGKETQTVSPSGG